MMASSPFFATLLRIKRPLTLEYALILKRCQKANVVMPNLQTHRNMCLLNPIPIRVLLLPSVIHTSCCCAEWFRRTPKSSLVRKSTHSAVDRIFDTYHRLCRRYYRQSWRFPRPSYLSFSLPSWNGWTSKHHQVLGTQNRFLSENIWTQANSENYDQ